MKNRADLFLSQGAALFMHTQPVWLEGSMEMAGSLIDSIDREWAHLQVSRGSKETGLPAEV